MRIILQSIPTLNYTFYQDFYIDPKTTAENALDAFKELEEIEKERNKEKASKDTKLQITIKDHNVNGEVIKGAIKNILDYYQITSLGFFESHLDGNTLNVIKDSIIDEKTLKEVDFSGNLLGDFGVPFVIEILTKNLSIRKCNLENNYIGNEGAKTLIDFLKNNKSLEDLNLSSNNISDPEILNNNLKYLDLTNNDIRDLSNKLCFTKPRQFIDLSQNPITELSKEDAEYCNANHIYLDLRDTEVKTSLYSPYILIGTEMTTAEAG